jgi:nitrite reductase/ring-hydroxylating ferredoxin subunit
MPRIRVAEVNELADGEHRVIAVGEFEVGVFKLAGRVVAYENVCPHFGGPVCQGKVYNRVAEIIMPDQTSRGLEFTIDQHIVCPWHGYEFNLDTGEHPGDPNVRLKPVPVRREGDVIYIDVPD